MLTSWVAGADTSGFPAEHLPYGVFSQAGAAGGVAGLPRVGVRIGDHVLDLARLAQGGLVEGPFDQPVLNPFMALGPDRWRAVRALLTELVCDPAARSRVEPALVPLDQARLHLPFAVADYVDFYSSIEHATNMGRLIRPDGDPLFPNWRHLPVAYHGRAGTVVVSGTPVTRPTGQRLGPDGQPAFGPATLLDVELELGFVVGLPSRPGEPVTTGQAPQHVFGVVLVNDWSARDLQAWEYQPLGPFLSKSFATSIGAWVTPLDALDACRVEGPPQGPPPLPHLALDAPWGLALDLSIGLRPAAATPEPAETGSPASPDDADAPSEATETISTTSAAGLYWRFPQQIAHLTSNGAHLRTGDLLASGTISGPTRGSEGSLVELTRLGTEPITIAGTPRSFLEDGDEVVLQGSADVGEGVTLILAEVHGKVLPAP